MTGEPVAGVEDPVAVPLDVRVALVPDLGPSLDGMVAVVAELLTVLLALVAELLAAGLDGVLVLRKVKQVLMHDILSFDFRADWETSESRRAP